MYKLTLDYSDEPALSGSSMWFETIDEIFDIIRKQIEITTHSYHIEIEEDKGN